MPTQWLSECQSYDRRRSPVMHRVSKGHVMRTLILTFGSRGDVQPFAAVGAAAAMGALKWKAA